MPLSKVLSTAGKVAGVIGAVAFAVSTAGIGGAAVAAVAKTVASYAAIASTVANVGASITAKKPPAQGSVTQTTIGTDQLSCEMYGRTYTPGARVHLVGYGGTVDKVKNPYLLAVDVAGVGGPYQACDQILADFVPLTFSGTAATGYFNNFLWVQTQLGQQYEASALTPHYSGAPGWSTASRLSGKPALLYSARFDKDGNVFASGFPQMGSVWRGVKAYDPRKDSTYPGGSGAHRWADPRDRAAFDAARATWEYTTNPGLLSLRYTLGTWERDATSSTSNYRKVFGVGMPIDSLVVADFVYLANVCDANSWKCEGRVFEPGSKWENLKRILAAGGAEPAWRGGQLGLLVQAPRVSLDTITEDDLADGEVVVGAMQGWEERLNTLVPKYRSEAHRWEFVASEIVQFSSQLAEDGGEEKREERQLDLVQNATQARQLCAYELLERRELGEIEVPCKPRLRRYGPGDLLTINLPEAGLVDQPAVVLRRSLDPLTMQVNLVLRGETIDKHAAALGLTGTAPPTPTLRTTEELDQVNGGEAGISPISVSTLPAAITIQAGPSGSPLIGELPAAIGNSATQAGFDVPITSISIVSQNACTASVVGTDVRITAVAGAMGDVVYDVTASGQTERKRVTFSVIMAGSDGTRAQAITITNNFSWSAYQQHGDTVAINASPSGKLSVNLTGSMRVALDAGEMRFQSKLQYRVAGGTWVDIAGSEAISTKSETLVDPVRVLAAQVNGAGPYALTGLSANAAYEVRALTRWYDGDVYPVTTNLRLYAEQVA